MSHETGKQKIYDAFWGSIELALFGLALFLSFPQWTSDSTQQPYTALQGTIAVVAFTLSRVVTAVRKRRSVVFLAGEVLLFCAFSWAMLLRFDRF